MTDKDLKKIGDLLDVKLEASEKRVMGEIGDFVDQDLLPQIAEKADKTDIDRLERKLDRIFVKNDEQDRRLDKVEAVKLAY